MSAPRSLPVRFLRGLAYGATLAFGLGLVLRVATTVSGGPLGMFPGGALAGRPADGAEPPLALMAAAEEIQLELLPERPRSVTTWVVAHEGGVYVPADFLTPLKRWPYQVQGDDRVVLRLEETLYPRRAVRVTDEATIAALREAFARKYAIDREGMAARSEVWFFRMEPRPPHTH